jgi:hypothetical protein
MGAKPGRSPASSERRRVDDLLEILVCIIYLPALKLWQSHFDFFDSSRRLSALVRAF